MAITYPDALPVSQFRDRIAQAIAEHQVVIVAGETGSGKTTQLPKICLDLGRAADGRRIGHTQPRRIAARAVAERISEELRGDGIGSGLGDVVGYQVRFTDQTAPSTRIKLMTDGILLAELHHDRDLRAYDTIIIDEAHERSLNIDFLLGYLKQLLPRRPDLKVVITSATIDPDAFARHFADAHGTPAPVIEVSGRTYPVEVRYRPLMALPDEDEEGEVVVRDQTEAIVDAVKELSREGPGDVLVFLAGEREIRDAAEALNGALGLGKDARSGLVEVVPLFSRLSAAEQHRVFAPHTGRRIVLATNVAETSLTVPGIRYVIDTGVARISRYSTRTKVQRLPIEPISQASADQRSGRCGRVEAGIAIRLYSEEDFAGRPLFTEPELLRTNLASVILHMAALGLGDVRGFPFLESPDQRSVQAGVQLLEELGALRGGKVTAMGRTLARLPVDPRLARMVVEADRRGCLPEVLVIASALSLQDPREHPSADHPKEQAQAAALHARFKDDSSDFLAWLNLWRHLRERQAELSGGAFRRLLKAEFLNYLRVREWQEFEAQLRQVCKEMGLRVGRLSPASDAGVIDADGVHQALLAGLLSHIGMLEERDKPRSGQPQNKSGRRPQKEYLGARGTRFAIFPGSALKSKSPAFVMAGELVDTSRLWARQVAAIKPEWVERIAGDLCKRTYSEPHWSRKRAATVARERVTLYGVPIVADRTVDYARIDPALARELFIRHALVEGDWDSRHEFLRHNAAIVREAEELEHRARRRDLVVDDEALVAFYDARLPADAVSGAHFDRWWKQARREHPDLLDFTLDLLTREGSAAVDQGDFPTQWLGADAHGSTLAFRVGYHFAPGASDDGVTIDVPLATLNRVSDADFSWNVPGLREELVTALIRGLPKALRVRLVPAPDRARAFLAQVTPGIEPLLDALERWLRETAGVVVARRDWALDALPPHLRPSYRVVDETGAVLGRGKDLAALKEPLTEAFAGAIGQVGSEAGLDVSGARTWIFNTIQTSLSERRAGHDVTVYPALADEGATVGLRVYGSLAEAEAAHRLGVARLAGLVLPDATKAVVAGLSHEERLAFSVSPYASVAALVEDARAAVVRARVDAFPRVLDEAAFDRLVAAIEPELETGTRVFLGLARRALAAWREADKAVSGSAPLDRLRDLRALSEELAALVHDGFVADAGEARLKRYPQLLDDIRRRGERLR